MIGSGRSPRAAWRVSDALHALRSSQKPPHGTPAYSRFVNRPLGRQLAARAVAIGLSPNQVSGLSAVCSFSAIALVIVPAPSVAVSIGVSALLVLGYALDSADGQVARLTRSGSPFGEWLDHMIDCTKINALHIGVAIHLFRFADLGSGWLLVPLSYLLIANVLFFGMILIDQLRRHAGADHSKMSGSLSVLRSLAILPTDFGALCLVFATLAWPDVFLVLYTVMFAGTLLLLVAALARWARQLRSLGGATP